MEDLKAKYLSQIAEASDEAALEDIRLAAVGKKGEVALKMRELGRMTPEERQVAGPALNALKDEINSALVAKKAGLADAALDARLRSEWLDVTLPTRARRQGTIHPISQVSEEVTAIFAEMGFSVAEGPAAYTFAARSTHLEQQARPAGVVVVIIPRQPRRIRIAYPHHMDIARHADSTAEKRFRLRVAVFPGIVQAVFQDYLVVIPSRNIG